MRLKAGMVLWVFEGRIKMFFEAVMLVILLCRLHICSRFCTQFLTQAELFLVMYRIV